MACELYFNKAVIKRKVHPNEQKLHTFLAQFSNLGRTHKHNFKI